MGHTSLADFLSSSQEMHGAEVPPMGRMVEARAATDEPSLSLRLLRTLIREEKDISMHFEHLEDLRRSGLSDHTIRQHRFRSLSRPRLKTLLGLSIAHVESGMLIPFPHPAGGFFDYARVKIFPPQKDIRGRSMKYLQPRGSEVHLFFPLPTLHAGLDSKDALYLVEGEKKSLAVAQLGRPAVGFCGIEGWHLGGSRALIADFEWVRLRGRQVELIPDGEWQTNPNVERGAFHLAEALEARGATVQLVVLPADLPYA